MATGKNIRTYYQGQWHDEDVMIMRAADHGAWLGSGVFDGARAVHGLTPDLHAHCARVNASAEALMVTPTVSTEDMVQIALDGLQAYDAETAVYIRPMYWAIHGDATAIVPQPDETGFALCLEEIPLAPDTTSVSLGKTRFRRPVLEDAVVNAKAGCLYPNNARMLAEVRKRGFNNALVTDAMGNVAESATANVFMVRDGVVFTPIPNGTFLAGITRARHISNLRTDGIDVVETVLGFEDFEHADEIFLSGNMHKVTAVHGFEDVSYQSGPITKRVREMYWDWAPARDATAAPRCQPSLIWDALSTLCRSSKAVWGYDDAFLAAHAEDLRVTPDMVSHPFAVTRHQGQFTAFAALGPDASGWALDALFVAPDHMGRGLGRNLLAWACDTARDMGAQNLTIVSDPFAEAFYTRHGARPVGSVPSEPPAGRRLPRLQIPL